MKISNKHAIHETIAKENIISMLADCFSIGVDIEDIQRFKNKDFNNNKNFYCKIFSKPEIKYCLSKKDPYPHFAARFCAKEAFIKAVDSNINFTEIEIAHKHGKPIILWNGNEYIVSLSHDNQKAVAFVLVIK